MVELAGQVVVITGAGNGLGRSHALAFAARGAKVVVNDVGGDRFGGGRDASAADRVVSEIRAEGGTAVASHASVSEPHGAHAVIARALDSYGRIDVLVNNAGILRDRSLANLSPDDIDQVLAVHLRGSMLMAQAAFTPMKEQLYGRMIHTSSASGLFGNFGQANYGAAKAGIVGLSRVIAIEGAKCGVRSNVIAPTAHTRLNEELLGAFADRFRPEQVSGLVAFLGSPQCQLTGEAFSVGGGRIARVFTGVTPGWFAGLGEIPTAEDVSKHLDEICREENYTVPASLSDEVQLLVPLLQLDA